MASIKREIVIDVAADTLRSALRDVGTDLLPDEMAPAIARMIEAGTAAMKKTLESPS
jgi:hypothetical protein